MVHEMCNSVSLYVSPSFANNPRWLWESVALYENSELVVARGGRAALVQLIRAHGDTAAVLGLSPAEFETAWYAYVRDRYLS